jgi:peptide/nickel transport system ATP-binding protein
MASIPRLNKRLGAKPRLSEIPGIVPSLREPIAGCSFAPRCRFSTLRCTSEAPELRLVHDGHLVACHEAETLIASGWSVA